MPKFPENKGFKMPGLGSKEKHTPGNFREEHQVDKIGYCDDTPINMLPPGSSPATFMGNEPLASSSDGSPLTYQWSLDDDPYTSVKYTPGALDVSDAFGGIDNDTPPVISEDDPEVNINMPEYKPELPEVPSVPKLTDKSKKTDKVRYTDLPEAERDAARKYNLENHGTHYTTELAQATGGKQGFDTSFDYTGDRDEAMRKKRKQMGYLN